MKYTRLTLTKLCKETQISWSLNEEHSTEKDATEKETIRGYPRLEKLHKMRNVRSQSDLDVIMSTHDVIGTGRNETCRSPKRAERVVAKRSAKPLRTSW